MGQAFVVDAVRSPMGKGKPTGALAALHPVDLLGQVLAALVARCDLDPAVVDDVLGGCVTQAGEQARNITRHALLSAGFPESVPATTIDRQCGSSQQAVAFAAQGIVAGAYDVVIACGVESMSRVPMFSSVAGQDPLGPGMTARYPDGLVHQGHAAELLAARWHLSREELDAYATRSHARAADDVARERHRSSIVPVQVPGRDGARDWVKEDETVRPDTTMADLAGLPAAFVDDAVGRRFPEIDWRVTAGNSSPLTDGAAAVLLMSEAAIARHGLTPRAVFLGDAVVGDDPRLMLTGVIPATHRVLDRLSLTVEDIDVFEVNEAFAAVPLVWAREMRVGAGRLNVMGGAIALGHPLGASGARITATLLEALELRGGTLGLQTICEAGGMANASVLQRL